MFKLFATGPDIPLRTDIDVDDAFRRHRMKIIIAITLGYAFSYTCRLAINVVKKPLIDGGIFTPDDLGTIGSALFYSYAAGKLINGFVADHANARRFFAIGLIISALCNIAMGFSMTVAAATIVWGINGWFQSYGAPACVISLASWFSNKERGRYYGIWSTAHSIGEGLNFLVTAALVSALGWHWGFWGPGIAVLVTAVATYFAMADRPRTMGLPAVADWKNDHYVSADNVEETPAIEPISNRAIIGLIVAAVLLAGLSFTFINSISVGGETCYYVGDIDLAEPGCIDPIWYRGSFVIAAILALIAFGFRYIQVKRPDTVFATQLEILKIPAMWVLAFSSALVYITRYAINSWGVLYLQEARGYSLVGAGTMLTVSTIAGIVGAVAFGFISDKYFAARRPPVNLLFGLIELTGLLLLFYGPQGMAWTVLAMILFGLGMTGLVTSVGGLFGVDICPKRVAGAALGMVGVFSYLGAGIQERVSGKLIDGGMTMVNGVRHYDFTNVIEFWIGASVISILLAATLWRTKLRD